MMECQNYARDVQSRTVYRQEHILAYFILIHRSSDLIMIERPSLHIMVCIFALHGFTKVFEVHGYYDFTEEPCPSILATDSEAYQGELTHLHHSHVISIIFRHWSVYHEV